MFARPLALRLLLSLLLVFAQQHGLQHRLGHSLTELAHKVDAGTVDEQSCAECLAFAHLDDAATPSGPPLPGFHGAYQRPEAAGFLSFAAPLRPGYRSRAPPRFS